MVRVADVEAVQQELVRCAVLAVVAPARRVRIREVSAVGIDVGLHVLRARLARRWRKLDELDGGTIDVVSSDGLAKETLDEVGVRRDPVHPLPPPELTEWLKDTVAVVHESVAERP